MERWWTDGEGEKRVLREKPGTVPLSTVSLTWTELGSKPGLGAERPVCLMLIMLHVATRGPHTTPDVKAVTNVYGITAVDAITSTTR